ncbi:hypothetical protein DL764_007432 [Monosporascus ibericus]|uniref:DUF3295 domain-containing protein n=1 Tax=Monosporascus ibericus TaxID=155417 RepID=A0A4Q4T0Q2_9PEZI|nr:hypothetical protein DL764_007432 [Monosporascus ibericus]
MTAYLVRDQQVRTVARARAPAMEPLQSNLSDLNIQGIHGPLNPNANTPPQLSQRQQKRQFGHGMSPNHYQDQTRPPVSNEQRAPSSAQGSQPGAVNRSFSDGATKPPLQPPSLLDKGDISLHSQKSPQTFPIAGNQSDSEVSESAIDDDGDDDDWYDDDSSQLESDTFLKRIPPKSNSQSLLSLMLKQAGDHKAQSINTSAVRKKIVVDELNGTLIHNVRRDRHDPRFQDLCGARSEIDKWWSDFYLDKLSSGLW